MEDPCDVIWSDWILDELHQQPEDAHWSTEGPEDVYPNNYFEESDD